MKARSVAEARKKKEAAVKVAGVVVNASRKEAVQPMVDRINKAGRAWYSISIKTFRSLNLTAADDGMSSWRSVVKSAITSTQLK